MRSRSHSSREDSSSCTAQRMRKAPPSSKSSASTIGTIRNEKPTEMLSAISVPAAAEDRMKIMAIHTAPLPPA